MKIFNSILKAKFFKKIKFKISKKISLFIEKHDYYEKQFILYLDSYLENVFIYHLKKLQGRRRILLSDLDEIPSEIVKNLKLEKIK